MAVTGDLVGLDAATLTTLRTEYLACLSAIASAQSYSIGGRSFTKADLAAVRSMLGEITYALNIANGTAVTETLPSFRLPYW